MWMKGVIRKAKIKNKYIKGSIGVSSIGDMVKENQLGWLEHVLRRNQTHAIKLVKEMFDDGIRSRR